MSMGVWSESAQTDDIAQLRQALEQARAERANRALDSIREKSPELVEMAESVVKSGKLRKSTGNGGRRAKGVKASESMAQFPYKDETAKRNFKVVYWDSDIRHVEYSPVTRNKSGQVIRAVDVWEVLGHSESFEMYDPLDIITAKETINDRLEREGYNYRLV